MFAPFNAAFSVPSSTVVVGSAKRDNVAPHVWGPSVWKMMHVIALTYPEHPTRQDMQDFATFFTSLQNVLPCEGCRKGYTQLIGGRYRLTEGVLSGRDALFRWTVDVHNAVNKKVGKRVDADYAKWFKHYRTMSAA